MLSYPELLNRAQGETARLKATVDELKTELDQMTTHYLRTGWHRGFDDYYAQRREVYTRLAIAERKLETSRARERRLAVLVAQGQIREPGVKAA